MMIDARQVQVTNPEDGNPVRLYRLFDEAMVVALPEEEWFFYCSYDFSFGPVYDLATRLPTRHLWR